VTDATNTPPQPSEVPPAPPVPDASSPAAPPYAPPAYGQQPGYGQQPSAAPAHVQPSYPQSGYGQPGYGQSAYGYGYAPARPTNVLAIVSLVASIAGLTILPFIASIPGIITGHMALKQLKTSGEQGQGLALWGTILGWIGGGLLVIGILIWVFVLIAIAATASSVGLSS